MLFIPLNKNFRVFVDILVCEILKSSHFDEYECEHEHSRLFWYALFLFVYFGKMKQVGVMQ